MALHFSDAEFERRFTELKAVMETEKLDAMLLFAQESMYWLTGYDTFGFCFFQCLVVTKDGEKVLLTRSADQRQARHTSNISDIRIWIDRGSASPVMQLKEMLFDMDLLGSRIGIEYDTHGMTGKIALQINAELTSFADLRDASALIPDLRSVKSPEEIVYVRKAAELTDKAFHAAMDEIRPGADEGRILSAMQGAIFEGGGDYPGNEFIIGSGGDALLVRYATGRKTLAAQDQLTLEFAGAYRHYHACLMRTIPVGPVPDHQAHMFNACAEALEACKAALRPGRPIGEVFDAHARVMDANGLRHARLNACGYSLGAVFAPIWMDYPMFYHGNPVEAQPGMVYFLHMILLDSDAQLAMTLGETVIVTDGAPERLSSMPLELVAK